MIELLKDLQRQKIIRALDYQFAKLLFTLEPDPVLAVLSALVSYQLGHGDVCVSLEKKRKLELFDLDNDTSKKLMEHTGIPFSKWSDHIQTLSSIGNGSKPTPLVYKNRRLYLYRYWLYEKKVAIYLQNSKQLSIDIVQTTQKLNQLFQRNMSFLFNKTRKKKGDNLKQELIKWLDIELLDKPDWDVLLRLYEQAEQPNDLHQTNQLVPDSLCLNWQKVAVAIAAIQSFTVISGGPGTGKTTTVTRLLALLIELAMIKGDSPIIKLVAPTGKAAARLTQAIGGALKQLACSNQVKELIPSQASTLHGLLGVAPNQNGFIHNSNNPLHLDILVVDEASMIDLPMMSHLLEALPSQARLILLGDRDQLASVEAGNVLGDICYNSREGYSRQQVKILEQLTNYKLNSIQQDTSVGENTISSDHLCLLQKSYRFDSQSGIGCLATAINQGSVEQIIKALNSNYQDISLHQHPTSPLSKQYSELIWLCIEGYRGYLDLLKKPQADVNQILSAFQRFQLLAALRDGPYGVVGLNEAIRMRLLEIGLIKNNEQWFEGRPVMITRNDHDLGLYNGDIGVTLKSHDGRLRVSFELPDHTIISLLPSRLPEHETVFAMTIHKSQGSEFRHVAMVLPDSMNPIITKELVYTGITRAKEKLDLFCEEKYIIFAANNPTQRTSGLYEQRLAVD